MRLTLPYKMICSAISLLVLTGGVAVALEIRSPAFEHNKYIPAKYTCQGEDISPALTWNTPPKGTKSFAIINDDPDAPMGTWIHWVIYDLEPSLKGLPENVPKDEVLGNGGKQGMTDFGVVGYGGPCPPPGKPHRYFFKIYALDKKLGIPAGATKEELLQAMSGHILEENELIGLYKR